MTEPILSIIVVNWNTREITRACLASVREHLGTIPYEVLVVDNASSDGSAEMVRHDFPWVRLLANDENVGFGRANNQAMRVARGEYFFLLNSDTLLSDDSLEKMVRWMETEPEVGIAGCKLLNEDRTGQISCTRFPSLRTSIFEELLLYKLVSRKRQGEILLGGYWDHDHPRDVDALWGAAMLVRRRVFEETGGFDEGIFMYGEDLEWCMRVRDRGWRIHFNPVCRIVHLDHRSSNIRYGDTRVDLSLQRGYDLYRRHNGAMATAALLVVKATGAAIRLAYFGLRSRLPGKNREYHRAQASTHGRVARFHARALMGRRLELD